MVVFHLLPRCCCWRFLLYFWLYFQLFAGYLSKKIAGSTSTIVHTLLLFPALWTGFEWLRGVGAYGFPWLWAGYSQTEGPLSALAPSIGALGLSYVLILIAASIALILQKKATAYRRGPPCNSGCNLAFTFTFQYSPRR